jgi:hypothetical protein
MLKVAAVLLFCHLYEVAPVTAALALNGISFWQMAVSLPKGFNAVLMTKNESRTTQPFRYKSTQ